MAVPINRASGEWIDVDALQDGQFSAYVEADVMVEIVSDNSGNFIHKIHNITSATIDPNGDTLYDAAPIGSLFFDGPGGKLFIKDTATTWIDLT